MSLYDNIAGSYNQLRSASIGVESIRSQIEPLGANIAVLDLGCGTGMPIAAAIAPMVNSYTAIDESQAMIDLFQAAALPAQAMVMNMEDLAFPPSTFDVIFSWGAFCHLSPEKQVVTLEKVPNLLKENGLLIFTGGESAGECDGAVGDCAVHHYSLGYDAYDAILSALGLVLKSRGYVEGGFFWYVYEKSVLSSGD